MQQLLNSSIALFFAIRDALTESIAYTRTIDPTYAGYASTQMRYYSSRCQAANILLRELMLWDCDILFRPALECATRFIFVSVAPPAERTDRIIEYTSLLRDVEDIERSEKNRKAARNSADRASATMLEGAALSSQREAELRAIWPRARRKTLKQKWSFTEIVRVLETVHQPSLDLRAYGSLLHSYGLSSHLIHADQTSMTLMFDRATRASGERKLLEEAHFARLAVQQTSLLFICWRAMEHANGRFIACKEINEGLHQLNEMEEIFHERFAESQSDLYARKSSEDG